MTTVNRRITAILVPLAIHSAIHHLKCTYCFLLHGGAIFVCIPYRIRSWGPWIFWLTAYRHSVYYWIFYSVYYFCSIVILVSRDVSWTVRLAPWISLSPGPSTTARLTCSYPSDWTHAWTAHPQPSVACFEPHKTWSCPWTPFDSSAFARRRQSWSSCRLPASRRCRTGQGCSDLVLQVL